MEYRKTLIGAASILALSVGLNQVAGAAVSQSPAQAKLPVGRDFASTSFSDPLLEFISLTQGSFTEETVHSALTSMYSGVGQDQIERLPELLNNIAALGLGSSVLEISRQTLIDIVVSSDSTTDEGLRANVVAQLEVGAGSIKLAQQEEILRRRGRRDPDVVGQVPGRDPSVIGQVGGGGY